MKDHHGSHDLQMKSLNELKQVSCIPLYLASTKISGSMKPYIFCTLLLLRFSGSRCLIFLCTLLLSKFQEAGVSYLFCALFISTYQESGVLWYKQIFLCILLLSKFQEAGVIPIYFFASCFYQNFRNFVSCLTPFKANLLATPSQKSFFSLVFFGHLRFLTINSNQDISLCDLAAASFA